MSGGDVRKLFFSGPASVARAAPTIRDRRLTRIIGSRTLFAERCPQFDCGESQFVCDVVGVDVIDRRLFIGGAVGLTGIGSGEQLLSANGTSSPSAVPQFPSPERLRGAYSLRVVDRPRNLAEWINPDDSSSEQTAGFKAALNDLSPGQKLVFPPHDGRKGPVFKFDEEIVLTKQIDLDLSGASIWGIDPDPDKAVIKVRIRHPSNGDADVRMHRLRDLYILGVDSGGQSAKYALDIEDTAGIGNLHTIIESSRLSVADNSRGHALRYGGSRTQMLTLFNNQITNGIHLDGCADGFRSMFNHYFGIKRCVVEFAKGAFCSVFYHDICTARDGFMHLKSGSQLRVVGTQIEQPVSLGANRSPSRASIEIAPTGHGMNAVTFEDINFGGSTRVDHHVRMGRVGAFPLVDTEFDGCTWSTTRTGVDVYIGDAAVQGTRFHLNQKLRGDRLATGFDPGHPGYPANNDGDPGDLFNVFDAGTGTMGVWQPASKLALVNGWSAAKEFRYRKNPATESIDWEGRINGGVSADSTEIATFPRGFRPKSPVCFVMNSDTAIGLVEVGADGKLHLRSGELDALLCHGAPFRARREHYNPGA